MTNYAALSVEELAAACFADAGARDYVGQNFRGILDRIEDARLEEMEAAYDDEEKGRAALLHELREKYAKRMKALASRTWTLRDAEQAESIFGELYDAIKEPGE